MSRIGTSELLTNFHEHYAELMAFLARRLGNVEQAADVAQDTYLRLVNLPAGEPIQEPRAFLFQVARNLLSDHWRRQKVRHAALADDSLPEQQGAPANDPLDHAQQQQRLNQLRQVLAELSPRRREALMLHRFECLTQAQIAERMNISVSMVEKHIAAALLQCKQRLDSDNGTEQFP